VRKAQEGNRRAFERLWKLYAPTVKGILLTMVQQGDAEDLTQEVAMSALTALPSLDHPESFPGWVCAIARNVARDRLRTVNQERGHGDASVDVEELPAVKCGDSAEADEIIAQIRELPECNREPLMLRLLLGMTGPEIARKTGLTEGSVRVNLCRGMKLLRQRLRDWEIESG
jgi:RNA polymerase sigma-70 factor (ECF subfamily)